MKVYLWIVLLYCDCLGRVYSKHEKCCKNRLLFMQIPVIFTDKYGLYTCLFCGQVFLDPLFLNFLIASLYLLGAGIKIMCYHAWFKHLLCLGALVLCCNP